MEEQIKINGIGIRSEWGAWLVKGGYEKLLSPAPMKSYITNTSRLNHGTDYVVHNPVTDSRELSLQFFIEGNTELDYLSKYKSFIDELEKGSIVLSVPRLKTIYKLVYIRCSSYGDYGLKKGKFTVNFIEPNVKDREVIE